MSGTISTVSDTNDKPALAANPLEQARLPEPAWLDEVEGEVADVELVLKCLSRESTTMCSTCTEVSDGEGLSSRPVLERCASTKA